MDRLARSTADLLALVARLERKGVALRVLSMAGGEALDTRTATGKLTLTVLGAVAEFERGLMLERQSEGIAKARCLSDAEQASLRAVILRGPGDGRDWTLPMLCRWLEARFDKRLHPASLSRIVRRLDLSRQKTRPLHPLADARAQAAFAKGGSRVRPRRSLLRIRTSA